MSYNEVQARIAALEAAWNAGDADDWVKGYADDCLLVNMLGAVLDGKEQNRARHAAVFAGIFRDSTVVMTIERTRFLGDGRVAVVDTRLRLTGHRGLPPGIADTEPGVLVMVMRHIMERRDDGWRIVFSQNQAIPPAPASLRTEAI